ncbi:ABC transporter ATP-binding protein [Amycolatopsis sp. NPDC005003]
MTSNSTAAQLLRQRWEIVRLTRKAGGPLIALATFVNLLLGALPVVFVVASALMVGRTPAAVEGGLGSPAWDALLGTFAVAAGAFIAQQVVAPIRESVSELVARRVDGRVIDEVMAASTGTSSIGPMEDPDVVSDLRVAARELEQWVQSPGQACAGQLTLLARYGQLVGYTAVVGAGFSWFAAAGLVLAVSMFRYGVRGGLRKYAQVRFDLDPEELKNDYLRRLTLEATAAKEIRVFGLIDFLRGYWRDCYQEWLKPVWAARRRIYLWPFVWYTVWGLAVSGGVLALLGNAAAEPGTSLTLTTYVMVITAALGALSLGQRFPESDLPTAVGMHAYYSVLRFLTRLDESPATKDEPADRPEAGETDVPEPVGIIHFDNVGFAYPGDRGKVFDGLDLTIEIGKSTALVGVNGAGKTTLVKLLARLYEPTEGAIYLDGVDIRKYSVEAWRARLGVIFQDFARYEVSAADNVGFGAAEHLHDAEGIRAAIEAVGLAETLDGLPRGLDTPLARHLEGGADLSGGQWQRVALARALFALRHGSSVLVLDEPTASLDVRAEAQFFREFGRLTEGATTLLISHRFSTVRQADRIVVLQQGQVTEQGSHDELMAANGRYAQLFRLQAERFTDRDEQDDEMAGMPR